MTTAPIAADEAAELSTEELEDARQAFAGKTFGNGRKEVDSVSGQSTNSGKRTTKAQECLQYASGKIKELFTDMHGRGYAYATINGHQEVLQLEGSRFRSWLRRIYYEATELPLTGDDVTNALENLKAQAEFYGNKRELYLRVAKHEGSIFFDLVNPECTAIKVTQAGWQREPKPPILFIRHRHHLEVSDPAPSGQYEPDVFDKFMALLNTKGEDQRLLLKVYLVALFFPEVPLPILMLHGEQGSAKSTVFELIKMLADPSSIRTRSFPRDTIELIQALSHDRVCFFDNISRIPEVVSDELCRAVTGSGFSKRRLFTDDEDVIYNFKRCIGINGINVAATKADLLDRGIIIQLERIPDEKRRKVQEIWKQFEELRSRLFSYILDVMVRTLQIKDSVAVESMSRMADFVELGEAISRAMGNPDNSFIAAYRRNIGTQTEQAIEASAVATTIMEFMETKAEWDGTVTELLAELEPVAEKMRIKTASAEQWPRAANALSRRLTEVTTNLRQVGISIERPVDKNKIRRVRIWKSSPEAPASPVASESFVSLQEGAGDDAPASNQKSPEIPPEKEDQEQIQNTGSGDAGDSGDDLQPAQDCL